MNSLAIILLTTNDSLGETFARGVGKGIGGLIVVGFLCLIIWIIRKVSRAFGYKSNAESIRSIQEQLKKEKQEQYMSDFERREKEKWAAYKAEKARKDAEEAQKKEDARVLAAMDELETGNLDKLTWGKALIAADGDEKRAKVEYLKIRKLD